MNAHSLSFVEKAESRMFSQMWNNIISISFKDEGSTKEWRQTLTMDFEGKYKQVSDMDSEDISTRDIYTFINVTLLF